MKLLHRSIHAPFKIFILALIRIRVATYTALLSSLLIAVLISSTACQHKQYPTKIDKTAEQLYAMAQASISKNPSKSIDLLDDLMQHYPSSNLIQRSMILQAYAEYLATRYSDAVVTIETFIKAYPEGEYVDYMHYLLGLCYYWQITNLGRDQDFAKKTAETMEIVVKKYAKSKYAEDARKKWFYAITSMAYRDLDVARFYLRLHDPIAAAGRLQTIITKYPTTSAVPEALYRMVEVYNDLGIKDQMQKYSDVLSHNFPNNIWQKKAKELLTTYDKHIETKNTKEKKEKKEYSKHKDRVHAQ